MVGLKLERGLGILNGSARAAPGGGTRPILWAGSIRHKWMLSMPSRLAKQRWHAQSMLAQI